MLRRSTDGFEGFNLGAAVDQDLAEAPGEGVAALERRPRLTMKMIVK